MKIKNIKDSIYRNEEYKAWMKAVYRLDDKYQAWFGTINRDKDGKPIITHNLISKDWSY